MKKIIINFVLFIKLFSIIIIPGYMMEQKKVKKSKQGKKNWRKNIDVTEIEEKEALLNKQEIVANNFSKIKTDELFDMDFSNKVKDNKLLNKKTKRQKEEKPKKIKKLSKNEKKKVKQIIASKDFEVKEEEKKKEEEIKDLWSDEDNNKQTKEKEEKIVYPKVPIAHPGQSYNPDKKDVQKLLKKVVELNQYLIKDEEKKKDDVEKNYFESEEESEEESIDLENVKISNNPPVDDRNRKTRKERRKLEIKKKNRLKNRDEIIQKQQRKILYASLSNKQLAKEKEKNEKINKEEKAKKEKQKKLEESLIKNGIISKDKKFFEDFNIQKEGVSLRTMKSSNNFLSERWENIMKRNVLGEYGGATFKDRRNRKLNQTHIIDLKNRDDIYLDDEKLKIIQ